MEKGIVRSVKSGERGLTIVMKKVTVTSMNVDMEYILPERLVVRLRYQLDIEGNIWVEKLVRFLYYSI